MWAHSTTGVDGAYADDDEIPTGDLLWTIEDGTERDLGIVTLARALLAEPPPLWFVHVDEPRATPPAANLVAFADPVLPPGTLVTKFQFGSLGVPNDRQVGAVRWYHDGGKVHQVFVAKEWRRQHVASTILLTAGALHQAHGWPGYIHGDGRRTVLGQLLIQSFGGSKRIAILDETMPPMDPPTAPPAEN